jgi:hypothetical protein
MRFIARVKIPTEAGNKMIKDPNCLAFVLRESMNGKYGWISCKTIRDDALLLLTRAYLLFDIVLSKVFDYRHETSYAKISG